MPDAELEAVPEAVPELALVVPDAEPVTVAAAGGGNSSGKPRPSPMESTSEYSESTSTGSAKGSALGRGMTRRDRDLCDRCRETEFSVTVSYIPLNLS